jgi:proteasome lid subunit RPN8/RPN11
MNTLHCPSSIVEATLGILKGAGKSKRERGVFWLANRHRPEVVVEAYEPIQETSRVLFWLPPESVRAMMQYLKEHQLIAVGQVHSHPGEAFHSETDDKCSLIGKVGAISVVVPNFAKGITLRNFVSKAAFFYLVPSGDWALATPAQVKQHVRIQAR